MMGDETPPSGRVTLVVTDVEGSGSLWELGPDDVQRALEAHDAVLREHLARFGGYEAPSMGDTFLLAFTSPADALRWAVAVQEALLRADWPEGILSRPAAAEVRDPEGALVFRGLRVRMGIHTGRPVAVVDGRTGRSGYRGPPVRRTQRLAGIAHGGQVLLSEETWRAAQQATGDEIEGVDLGPHRFAGLPGMVRVVEARPAGLEARRFPPLGSMDALKTNLVVDSDALVGREPDLAALVELFSFGVRMVTVVGPPGSGKSRLAREFAARVVDRYGGEDQGGVWVAELADVEGSDGLLQAVASAADVPLTLGRQPQDSVLQLGHALSARGPLLLVLDGFERHRATCSEIVLSWLRQAPAVRFLVTADRRLGVEREVAYELGPLGHRRGPRSEESAALLRRRLSERGEARPSGPDRSACDELLDRAAGLPLAIELLAGQVGAAALADLAADVGGRLGDGPAGSPARLQAVFDAVLSRLRPWERGALARCSVFRGGFDQNAAEHVIDLSEWAGAPWVGDTLQRLRELGLVRQVETAFAPGLPRYELHPFVREAVRASFPPTDVAVTEDRHAAWFVDWGERWAQQVAGPGGQEALARLDQERINLVAVVRNCLALRPLTPKRVDHSLRAVLVLSPLLATRGPFGLHLELLDLALEAAQGMRGVDARLRVRALCERAEASRLRGRWREARADVEQALQVARETGFVQGEADALEALGQLLRLNGQAEEAVAVLEQALERARETGNVRSEALVLGNRGVVFLHLGRVEEAQASIRAAIECFRKVGDRRNEGVQTGNLGVIQRRLGNLARTRELYREALEIHRETGDRRREGVMLGNLGVLHFHLGDRETAYDLYDQSLGVAREVGDRRTEATALANIGLLYTEQGATDDALGLFHQALALNRDVGELAGEGCDAGFLATLHHLQGDLEKARDHYRRSLELLERTGERRYAGSFLSWAAACEAEREDLDAARALFDASAEALGPAGDPHLLAARQVLLGALDLVEARRRTTARDQVGAARAREAARGRITRVREEVSASGEPLSGDLRLAILWLETRLGDLA